jgi:hypothetical protein
MKGSRDRRSFIPHCKIGRAATLHRADPRAASGTDVHKSNVAARPLSRFARKDMTREPDPRAVAAEQCAAIRDALYVSNRPLTVAEIAAFVSLPPDVVARRLNAAGPGVFRSEWRVFQRDQGKWALTALGQREAERAARG